MDGWINGEKEGMEGMEGGRGDDMERACRLHALRTFKDSTRSATTPRAGKQQGCHAQSGVLLTALSGKVTLLAACAFSFSSIHALKASVKMTRDFRCSWVQSQRKSTTPSMAETCRIMSA